MRKVKSIMKRMLAVTAAAFMGTSAVCVTAPIDVHATSSISVDDLYDTMDEALNNLWNSGFDYYSAGTCTVNGYR